jgi:hypothetical protein
MWERLGFPCRGSGLRRGVCVTSGDCSGWRTATGSAGLTCGAGCCCIKAGFSSTGAGEAVCASNDAFPLLLRPRVGAAEGSLGSAGLRGFLGFFSSFGSLGLGFGPGFLRTAPDAVRRGVEVVDVETGVGVVATPTPPVATRIVELFGVPCSGEWGGELKLPGEDATSVDSMAAEHENHATAESSQMGSGPFWRNVQAKKTPRMEFRDQTRTAAGQLAQLNAWVRLGECVGRQPQHQSSCPATDDERCREHESRCARRALGGPLLKRGRMNGDEHAAAVLGQRSMAAMAGGGELMD